MMQRQAGARIVFLIGLVAGWLGPYSTSEGASPDFQQLTRSAIDRFTPVDQQEVASVREELARRVHQLEQYLRPGSENGEAWKRYLLWDQLTGQLSGQTEPDRRVLERVLDRFTANQPGLELVPFRRVTEVLQTYVDLVAFTGVSDQERFYETQLDLLADYLQSYREDPTPRTSYEIARRLDFIVSLGQAPELVRAIRQEFSKPNLYIDAHERLLQRMVNRPVNRVEPVRECILGTDITGTSCAVGQVSLDLLPAADRAKVALFLTATADANTVGVNGPVNIYSGSRTQLHVTKVVELTDPSFWVHPANAAAHTNSYTRSVQKRGGGLGSRLIEGIARNRVEQSRSQADRIAASRAEQRAERQFDQEVAQRIQEARQNYQSEFRLPLMRRGSYPPVLQYSTTSDALRVEALEVDRGQLGAWNLPPAPPLGQDLAVRIHQSGGENSLELAVGGATLSQSSPDERPRLDKKLPEWIDRLFSGMRRRQAETVEDFRPWSIQFRSERPVSLAFRDHLVTVTVHAARINTGEESYEGWDLTAQFVPQREGNQIVLVRDGEIDVLPTNFDPTAGRGLGRRQLALRSNLSREINRRAEEGEGIPQRVEIEPVDFQDDLDYLGALHIQQVVSSDGWLTLSGNVW